MTPLSYVYNEVAKRLERDTLIDIPPSCKSIFRKLSTINTHKQLIGTIDISKGEPKLVKSSQIT